MGTDLRRWAALASASMRMIEVPPSVGLMNSMRSVGYTLEASAADLIDNSVTAGADRVEIITGVEPEPYIAFLDNGSGMDEEDLLLAMSLGAKNPDDPRSADDLGRFGLGLKTASLAHARCLTVVTKRAGNLVGARWDLARLEGSGRWDLEVFSEDECRGLPQVHALGDLATGTLVIWTDLDQLLATTGDMGGGLDAALVEVRDHLGLVYHRYLRGDATHLDITVNGNPVQAADPFMESHRKTMSAPPEHILVEDVPVTFQAYTLPVPSALSQVQRDRARLAKGLRDTQGFYIYRNKRLIVAGSWFDLIPRGEMDKLTRVRMDIPNTLDHLWHLDVKKATARPPAVVRQKIRHLMRRSTEPSRKAIQFRGRNASADQVERIWNVIEDRDTFRYEINRSHPLVVTILDSVPEAKELLPILEESAPWEDAYARHAQDQVVERSGFDDVQLAEKARAIADTLMVSRADELADLLTVIEPFNSLSPQQLKVVCQGARP